MVKYELYVGSAAFWRAAAADIAAARRRVLVQAMTFEADTAGRAVFDAVAGARAAERRILVDSYSRMVVNDRFVALPGGGAAYRAEVAATRAMFAGAGARGIAVRRTNPVGRNPVRYGVRNHKKLIVADGVAWIGGINFADHNFAWRDMMLRIADADAVGFLARDFAATWEGRAAPATHTGDALTLMSLDGRSNAGGFAPLMQAIADARERIDVVSAYPTFPFVDALEAAARRGVAVEVLTPLATNKPIVRDALLGRAPVPGFTVRLVPEMTHIKGMLVDGTMLAMGSANFDFAAYVANEEYLALVRDPHVVARFHAEVLDPLRAVAVDAAAHRPSRWRAWRMTAGLHIGATAIAPLARARRTTVDWD